MDLYLLTISSEPILNCLKPFMHSVRITQINMKIFYEPVRHSKFGIARVSVLVQLNPPSNDFLGELIILSQKDYSRRVFMLKDFHIRMLEQKVEMIQKINELRDSLEKAKMIAENNSEKFSVHPSLLKYVVGAKGANISKARCVHYFIIEKMS